jgi:hypothetical protein
MLSKYYSNDIIKNRVSYSKKKAYNFERQKKIAELVAGHGKGIHFDKKRKETFKMNYDLLNGRVDTKLYNSTTNYNVNGEKFQMQDAPNIVHYPLIAQVCQSMIGEQMRRPFVLSVEDLSPFKENFEAKEYNRFLKQDLITNFLGPIKEQVANDLYQQLGVNPQDLNEEQASQLAQQIDAQAKALSPEEVIDYMENDYRTPVAKQGQEIINFLSQELELKQKNLEGFIHMLPTGEGYYYVSTHRDKLVFESVPPDEITYGGSPNKVWAQDMDWVVRTQYKTLPDVTETYAEFLTPSMIQNIESAIGPMDTGYNTDAYTKKKWQQKMGVKLFIKETAENGDVHKQRFNNLDTRTKEGHRNAMKIYDEVMDRLPGGDNISNYGLKIQHIVFKDECLMKKVTRYNKETKRQEHHWFDEHYAEQEGDIKILKVWIKEPWEATIIGGEHFVKVQPLEYNWSDKNDPYNIQLPYIGRKYFTYKNRTRNRSVIDAGKALQRDFDIQMARLKHTLKTNMGKMFVYHLDMKPKDMPLKEFFTLMKDFSVITVQDKKHGSSPLDPNLIKDVDASKMAEIADNINLLEFFRKNLFTQMYFSEARAGSAGQYTSNENIASQQTASYNQTELIYDIHRNIFEKSVNRLLNISRLHYKNHPDQIEHILSPISLQELRAGRSFFYTEMGVNVDNSGFALQQIEFLKSQMIQLMAGAGGQGLEMVLELSLADSKSDIINITRKFSKNVAKQQQQQQEFEATQQQQSEERKAQAVAQKEAVDYKMHTEILENKKDLAILSREIFKIAGDIDKNNKSDLVDAKELQLEFDREELETKTEVEYAKMGRDQNN